MNRFLTDNLKSIYDSMDSSLKSEGKDNNEIYDAITDYCTDDPDRWDLSDDEHGDIWEAYQNNLSRYLKL